MITGIRKTWERLFNSNTKRYEDYDIDYECTLRDKQINLNARRALEHFYMNRMFYLSFYTEEHKTFDFNKEDFIYDIYKRIERKPEVKFSSYFSVTNMEDYVWTKNAYYTWNSSLITFQAQFDRLLNRNTYKQERRDYKAEWEAFKQMHDKDYHKHYRQFNRSTPSGSQCCYYTILGLSDNVKDMRAVKLAYRNKMKEHHPDKFAGSSIEERQKNEEFSKKINEAYTYLEKKLFA